MSFPTQPAFIFHGTWGPETRAHPALLWFEDYVKNVVDAQNWSTDAGKWITPTFTLQKSTGQVFAGADAAWPALAAMYAPFAAHLHAPTFASIAETDKGWEMVGQAVLFGDLQGPPAEKAHKDAAGRAWEVAVPSSFYFVFEKTGEGVRLSATKVFSDSAPAVVAMLKKGVLTPEQLLAM